MIGYDIDVQGPFQMGLLRQAAACRTGNARSRRRGSRPGAGETSILLIGGDKRGDSPTPSRPVAQSRDILVYDVMETHGRARGNGPWASPRSRRCQRYEIMTISGETARASGLQLNASASAGYHFEMSTVDYAVLIDVIVLAIIIVSAVRNGVELLPPSRTPTPSRACGPGSLVVVLSVCWSC